MQILVLYKYLRTEFNTYTFKCTNMHIYIYTYPCTCNFFFILKKNKYNIYNFRKKDKNIIFVLVL